MPRVVSARGVHCSSAMPLLETLRFGALEYPPEGAIDFPSGVPGFEHLRRFVLVEQATLAPLVFLQSLEAPDLCFPAVPMGAIDPQYELEVSREDLEILNLDPSRQPEVGRDVVCLAIVTAPNGPPTANLLAPVVINLSRGVGVQAVRTDARYSHCYRWGETRRVAPQPCS
jgi:flagellar assembly factor FliW